MKPEVSILIPWLPEPTRIDGWRYVRNTLIARHPDWEVLSVANPGRWSKAAAINHAVEQSTADILIIHDADVICHPKALAKAVELISEGWAWCSPLNRLNRLDRETSLEIMRGELDPSDGLPGRKYQEIFTPGCGAVVLPRDAWEKVNGWDERFQEWGGEDYAIGCALDTLWGEHCELDAPAWHLWHTPAETSCYGHSDEATCGCERFMSRVELYSDARFDSTKMERLVAGNRKVDKSSGQ